MGSFLKEYFNLSNIEQKGVIAFISLIIIIVLVPKFYQIFKTPQIESSTDFEKWAATFSTEENNQLLSKNESRNLHIESIEKTKEHNPSFILYSFNPNTVSKENLIELGIKEKTAETFIKFRNSGAKFYKKEDFKNVYGISDEDYKRLENYIVIPKDTAYQIDKKPKKDYEDKVALKLELNFADSADFIKLSGIGPVFASRIVKYREKLGGYLNKSQLMEVYGITDTLYQKIDSFLLLDTKNIQKINLNTADFKTFINHPYIDYNVTNSILKYRDQNGNFERIEDLKLLYSLDEKTIEKIKPYLTIHE